MFPKLFAGAVMFFVAVAVGICAGRTSWRGVIFLTSKSFSGSDRNPAAIRRDLDFSHLNDDELITASQKRLITAAKVILDKDEIGVELGHFVTRDEAGEKKLACDYYDRMILAFESEGISEGGEKPTMEIEGPCRVASDITRIEPIWIPVQKILSETAADMDLSYPGDGDTNYRFKSMTAEWPMQWRLKNVRLFNTQEGGRQVSIGTQELSQLTTHPIEVNWNSTSRTPTSDH